MYKCSECQKEYETRPAYCDCGNDSFIKIVQAETSTRKNKSFLKKHDISAFALTFFAACLLLSVLIILIPTKQSQTQDSAKHLVKTEKTAKANIPDLDSIWQEQTNPPARTASKTVIKEPPVQKTIFAPKTLFAPKTVQQTKSAAIQKTSTNAATKAAIKTPQPKVAPKTTSKAASKTISQTTPQTTKKNIQTTAPKTNTPKVVKTMSQEVVNYKIALRSALFTNLAITSIQGSGKCGIEFNIDKNGKLTNRAFTFQSDNKTVNDEVYKMLMKMPKFYPPPDSYRGEKIKMTFAFDYGNYVINYTN